MKTANPAKTCVQKYVFEKNLRTQSCRRKFIKD